MPLGEYISLTIGIKWGHAVQRCPTQDKDTGWPEGLNGVDKCWVALDKMPCTSQWEQRAMWEVWTITYYWVIIMLWARMWKPHKHTHTHIPTKPYRQEVVTKSYIFKIRFIVIVREVLHNQAIVFSYELKYTIFNIVLKILQDAMQGPKMSI